IVLTVEPVVLHSHVLAFEITRFFTEPFKKRGGLALGRTGRHTADKAAYRHSRLLRPRRARPCGRRAAEKRDELAPFDHSIILESAARCFPLGIRVRLRARARLGEFANRAHKKSSATTIMPTPSTSQPGRIISKSNAPCRTLSGETLAWMPSAIASPMNVNATITPLSAINIHVDGSLRVLRHQTSIR